MCLSTQEKQHGICHLPFGTLPTDPAVTAQIHRRTAGLILAKPAGYSPHPEEGPKLATPICVYLHRCGIVFDLVRNISKVTYVFNKYQTHIITGIVYIRTRVFYLNMICVGYLPPDLLSKPKYLVVTGTLSENTTV